MDIPKEKAKKLFESSDSKTEFAKKLGFDYYGGHSRKVVNSLIKKYNLKTEFDRGKKNRKYPKTEKNCPVCGEKFEVRKGHPKEKTTCSYSCSNKYFDHGQGYQANKKRSETLKEYYENNPSPNGGEKEYEKNSCKIHSYKECKMCGKLFVRAYAKEKKEKFGVERKTCSEECKVQAQVGERTYQNGSRKPKYYENPNTGESVLLESSWEVEVAELLDEKDTEWTRPDPIKWEDDEDKTHRYYPDFYLPNFDLYLDPKNSYCMDLDKEKMNAVSQKIDLIYGSLDKVVNSINDLK
jgi:hypothetical protein